VMILRKDGIWKNIFVRPLAVTAASTGYLPGRELWV
jgi:hypothetical protein